MFGSIWGVRFGLEECPEHERAATHSVPQLARHGVSGKVGEGMSSALLAYLQAPICLFKTSSLKIP